MWVYRSVNGLRKSSSRTRVSLALWTSKAYCLFIYNHPGFTDELEGIPRQTEHSKRSVSLTQSFTQNASDLTFFDKLIFNISKLCRNIRSTEDILHQLIGSFLGALSQYLRALTNLGRIFAEFWPSTVAPIPSPQCDTQRFSLPSNVQWSTGSSSSGRDGNAGWRTPIWRLTDIENGDT